MSLLEKARKASLMQKSGSPISEQEQAERLELAEAVLRGEVTVAHVAHGLKLSPQNARIFIGAAILRALMNGERKLVKP